MYSTQHHNFLSSEQLCAERRSRPRPGGLPPKEGRHWRCDSDDSDECSRHYGADSRSAGRSRSASTTPGACSFAGWFQLAMPIWAKKCRANRNAPADRGTLTGMPWQPVGGCRGQNCGSVRPSERGEVQPDELQWRHCCDELLRRQERFWRGQCI